MHRTLLALLGAVCVVAAACADDDDDTAAAPGAAATSTTASSATTTAPDPATSGTSATSTTAESTTSPTTARPTVPPSAAPAHTAPPSPAETPVPYVSELYADRANWICRPDVEDLCDSDLDVTDVAPDGTTGVRPFEAAVDAPVDCFYVYPTNSEDLTANSDLVPGNELFTTRVQAARFSQVCDVYAPLYRSMTLAALVNPLLGDTEAAFAAAYDDVLDAWQHYLANDNDGRGVIVLGHSQGTFHLNQLLREEVEPDPQVRSQLVGAYLLGGPVTVPIGEDVGGDLEQVPLCRSLGQPGCVVTYASFRSTAPPPPDAYFGRPLGGDGMAGCVNPAAPGGGSGELDSAFPSGDWALTDRSLRPSTPFMNFPGFVTAECVYENGFSYLELTLHPDPADARTDDLVGADFTPPWGTHLIDVQVASGTLLEFARQQIAAYVSAGA